MTVVPPRDQLLCIIELQYRISDWRQRLRAIAASMRLRDCDSFVAVDESSCYSTRLDLPEACNQGSRARKNEERQRTKGSARVMIVCLAQRTRASGTSSGLRLGRRLNWLPLTPTRLRVVLVSLSRILASPKSATLARPSESKRTETPDTD